MMYRSRTGEIMEVKMPRTPKIHNDFDLDDRNKEIEDEKEEIEEDDDEFLEDSYMSDDSII